MLAELLATGIALASLADAPSDMCVLATGAQAEEFAMMAERLFTAYTGGQFEKHIRTTWDCGDVLNVLFERTDVSPQWLVLTVSRAKSDKTVMMRANF